MTQLESPSDPIGLAEIWVPVAPMWTPVGERPPAGLQPADIAWLVGIVAGLVFEFSSKDLLSDSSARACKRNPLLARLAILSLAGHLAVVVPAKLDLFNAKNLVHRGIALSYGRIRARRRIAAERGFFDDQR